ncbi:hypothetical protein KFF05_01560 [bacterium SCSIO 12827]|nr:hypothetical protein KFF05_01560 [bacterium SCSIO 12827]
MYDLNEIVIAAGNEVCREMEIIYERLLITSCWVNIGRPGVVHKEHAHPNNFLSVVFYVNVPVGGSSITFSDPRVQANVIVPRTRRVTPLTAKSVSLEAVTGRLLIFPAWLRHSVKANDSNELRVSISYDLQFDNYTLSMAPAMFPGNFRYNRT